MKKIALKQVFALGVIATASGFACAQTSSVQLYGVVDAAVRYTNHEGATRDDSLTKMIGGGMSQSRWGVNVTEDLGGGLKAIANFENRFATDDGTVTTPFFQQSWVGLQGGFGRLTMGRQYNMLFDLVTSTYASFPYSPYMDAYKPELGMAMGARASNMLKYTAEVGPIRGSLQYSFGEKNDTASLEAGFPGNAVSPGPDIAPPLPGLIASHVQKTLTGGAMQTAGGYLRYAANGIAAGAGFLRTELPGGTKVDAWTLGGSYRTGPWYLNAGYALNKADFATATSPFSPVVVRNAVDRATLGQLWTGASNGGFMNGDADKRQMFKVGVGYQVTPQLNAGVHYFHAKQSGSASGNFNGKANFLVAVADYAFSKRTDAYFGVDHTRVSGGTSMALDKNGAQNRTGITAGLRHRF